MGASKKLRLSKVTLENFRIFEHEESFDLAPITLLIGPNNSGKSSVLKAIRLFKQAAANNSLYGISNFNKIGLGSNFEDVQNEYSNNKFINLSFSFANYSFDFREISPMGARQTIKEGEELIIARSVITKKESIQIVDLEDKEIIFDLGVHYLAPVRGNVARELHTFEIQDPFTRILETFTKAHLSPENIDYLKKWFLDFGIADSIDIHAVGKYASAIELTKHGKTFNLAQMGSGTAQLLPMLMQTAIGKGDLILLEEPDNNLHPNYQALLADVFADAYHQFNTHFIVETHSEYLLRKLQVLVKRGTLNPSDVAIYYFKDGNNIDAAQRATKLTIDENGELNGKMNKGFMDEADSLTWELLRTNKPSKH
ncbi:MAG: AAA family ATPase [Aureispira sp.]|nr:AAA family ATPase [Aureispira sp.]